MDNYENIKTTAKDLSQLKYQHQYISIAASYLFTPSWMCKYLIISKYSRSTLITVRRCHVGVGKKLSWHPNTHTGGVCEMDYFGHNTMADNTNNPITFNFTCSIWWKDNYYLLSNKLLTPNQLNQHNERQQKAHMTLPWHANHKQQLGQWNTENEWLIPPVHVAVSKSLRDHHHQTEIARVSSFSTTINRQLFNRNMHSNLHIPKINTSITLTCNWPSLNDVSSLRNEHCHVVEIGVYWLDLVTQIQTQNTEKLSNKTCYSYVTAHHALLELVLFFTAWNGIVHWQSWQKMAANINFKWTLICAVL